MAVLFVLLFFVVYIAMPDYHHLLKKTLVYPEIIVSCRCFGWILHRDLEMCVIMLHLVKLGFD